VDVNNGDILGDVFITWANLKRSSATADGPCDVSKFVLCFTRYGIRNVSNSKRDLQGHSRASAVQWCRSIGHIRFAIRVVLQRSLYLAPITRYYHLFPKISRGHVTHRTSIPFFG